MSMFCFTRLDDGEVWLNADQIVMVIEDYNDRKGFTKITLSNGAVIYVKEKVDMVIMSLSAVENAENS